MSLVVVYSKPNCMQCEQTKNILKRKGVDFTVVDVSEDAEAFAKVTEMGYRQLPVVVYGENHWSGFNPSRLGTITN